MAEETQSIEQTLEKTDFGHFVNTNKDSILIAAGVVIALIIGFSVYKHNSDKNDLEILNSVHKFHSSQIAPYLEAEKKDLPIDKIAQSFLNLSPEVMNNSNVLSSLFLITARLEGESGADKLIPVYEAIIKNYQPKEYTYYFLAQKLAVLLENAGEADKAISILETLVSANHELLKTRIYLELGRLYKNKGQIEKAQANLNFVIDTEKDSKEAKIAKIFLMQLKK